MVRLEGAIIIDDEKEKCSVVGCKEKVVGATVNKNTKKGLTFDEYCFWCKEHYKKVIDNDLKFGDK